MDIERLEKLAATDTDAAERLARLNARRGVVYEGPKFSSRFANIVQWCVEHDTGDHSDESSLARSILQWGEDYACLCGARYSVDTLGGVVSHLT